jgi:hypothetical protein
MDPLSFTASLIAVLGVAGAVAKSAKKIHYASNEIMALQNEVADLQAVFKQFENLAKSPWARDQQVYLGRAQVILGGPVRASLERIQKVLDNKLLKSRLGKVNKPAWVFLEKKIITERNDLRRAKAQLVDIFNLLTLATVQQMDSSQHQTQSQIIDLSSASRSRHNKMLEQLDQQETLTRNVFHTIKYELQELRIQFGKTMDTTAEQHEHVLSPLRQISLVNEASSAESPAPSIPTFASESNTLDKDNDSGSLLPSLVCTLDGRELYCSR